jgi:60 kDa SS-A/Ro ribonucleoprotein
MTRYAQTISNPTQREPLRGTVPNSAGGYSFLVDDRTRAERFLILGNEGGSYYASERQLTRENATAVEREIKRDGLKLVQLIVDVSTTGRAYKQEPAIFALAMAAKLGSDEVRRAAYQALPSVCRIPTHLFAFMTDILQLGGVSRGTRDAVNIWYNYTPLEKLAYQLIKYQSRNGMSNRDVFWLTHVRGNGDARKALYRWVESGVFPDDIMIRPLEGFKQLQGCTDAARAAHLITEYELPRECVPTELLNSPAVWEALLQNMPMTAMIRNLPTMTRVGLLTGLDEHTRHAVDQLGDAERLRKALVHPIQILIAQLTYSSGHGKSAQWTPVPQITDALNDAFYTTFHTIMPSGKRLLIGLDVSGSMSSGNVAGVEGLTPCKAAAAMCLVTANAEPTYKIMAFADGLQPLNISPKMRLDDVVRATERINFGGTDCALPMLYANRSNLDVDQFIVYTDSETWAGSIHPVNALHSYRQARGIPAKLVVVGMVSNGFSIADPNDAGMLDVVGFDSAAPTVISDFARS